MRIKSHLRTLERRGSAYRAELATLFGKAGFSGLDCRGGGHHLGFPRRVTEFIEEYDWTTIMWQMGDSYEGLKQEICKFWSDYAKLKPEQIKIRYGSMPVLRSINQMFMEQGTLGCAPQFYGYVIDVVMSGINYKPVPLDPEENFRFNPDNLLTEIKPDCCLIYIDNPNNPTGQLISLSQIEEIVREAKRKDVAVLVDEAYADYAGKENSAVSLLNRYDNLMVTRTFTKGYQFAEIRVGYGIFPDELSAYYDKIDFPFAIPVIGASLAREALLDQEFLPDLRQRVKSVKDELIKGLKERDYLVAETYDACPIFLLGHKNKDVDLWHYLIDKGILTLPPSLFTNLEKNYVRVTIPAKVEDFLTQL